MVRRFRWLVVAIAVLAAVVLGTAAVRGTHSGRPVDQCSLPLSQRTGGWTCYQP
jgi:hypothetical protein